MLKIIKKYSGAFIYASEELKLDKGFVLDVVGYDPRLYDYIDSMFKNDDSFAFEAFKRRCYVFTYFDDNLKIRHPSLALKFIKLNGTDWFHSLPKELKASKKFILKLLKIIPKRDFLNIIRTLDWRIRQDPQFMLEALYIHFLRWQEVIEKFNIDPKFKERCERYGDVGWMLD